MDGTFMRTTLVLDHFLSLLHYISHHCPWTSALTVHARQDRNGLGRNASQPWDSDHSIPCGSCCSSVTSASVFRDVTGRYEPSICFSLSVCGTLIPCREWWTLDCLCRVDAHLQHAMVSSFGVNICVYKIYFVFIFLLWTVYIWKVPK